jgi:thiaminase/transcriptional activator TenA
MRTALQGDFIDIMTILYVTEGTYLDWATRLLEAGRRPDTPKIYAEWIDIHGPEVLGELVEWLRDFIDNADIGNRRPEIERIFRTTLRYEYRFWQSGYHGEEWD